MNVFLMIVLPVLIAFALTVAMGPVVIPFLLRLKVGQTVRDDGPQSHIKKNGTPTMGGVMILAALLITSLFYIRHTFIIPILVLTIGYGLIGFADDYIKVVLKRSMGLRAWQKLVAQIIVTGAFAYYLVNFTSVSLALKIPFMSAVELDLGIWNIPLLFFVALGTANGTNFTDGVDGLASSVTAVVALFFTIVAAVKAPTITPVTGAMFGALLGFLVFNLHPAKVFMGDTGSLALGGFVAATAYALEMPLFILIIGFIYLLEVVSVILQVGYFKLTHGKRIFRMAPIHHHFELGGWSETKVVGIFTIVTILLCLVAYAGI